MPRCSRSGPTRPVRPARCRSPTRCSATRPSGDLFGWTQNAGMGWNAGGARSGREFLILRTQGGMRAADGTPIALGYHTGHWEVGLLVKAAAEEFKRLGGVPFAGAVHRSVRRPHAGHDRHVRQPAVSQRRGDCAAPADPLAADAARRARRRDLRQGPAGDDDGAGGDAAICRRVLVPGGVTLPPSDGEDAGKVQTHRRALRARRDHARTKPPSWAAAPAPRPAAAASSWARRRRRRSSARRSGCRCRTRRWRRRASRSGSTWRGARRAR